ncbi:NAD(P)-binding domain-containing protein, partial [Dysgonomonas capnocytophagoides]|uniref:NAD(P)-binding domain-containing protein n=1 Tax=Dysgonomonas capnocytophagoides TaxID=45254 RepID=UPI002A7FBB2E
MNINVIGLGYIGLPTALMFAANGVNVVGTDLNESIVNSLKKGEVTFEEEGLSELFDSALKSGIHFTTQYASADAYIISVPTPYDSLSKKIDPTYVNAAIKCVLDVCPKGAIIIIESTVSPG